MKRSVLLFGFFLSLINFSCKNPVIPLDRWEYQVIDTDRTSNDLVPEWACFGMDFGDGNKDGIGEIAAGKWFYFLKDGKWNESKVMDTIDILFITDVDDDSLTDLIALRCNEQYWIEAADNNFSSWNAKKIGKEPICSHKLSSMGFIKADVYAGGKPELLITDEPGKIWIFEIPDKSDSLWPVWILTPDSGTVKFMAAADFDNDGDLDIASGFTEDGKMFNGICWFENPDMKGMQWNRHVIGHVDFMVDHLGAADFNKDGQFEILVTEGRSPQTHPAGIYLFSATDKKNSGSLWRKDTLSMQYSTNSLEIADMDLDGDLDFVTGEHKGTCRLQIFENDGTAKFIMHVIDSLKESHNGTKLFDLEGDGDLDITTTGWFDHKHIHVWINKAKK